MEKDLSTLENKLSELNKKSSFGEHILNIIKGILASAPFTGGISSLMTDYIPNTKQKRLEEFAKQVAEDLLKVKDKIDNEVILNDNFAFMFESSFRKASENYQKVKLNAFRGIIINSAIRKDITNDEKEYFLNLTNNLTVLHLLILKFMATPEKYLEEMNIPQNRISGGFSSFFPVAIPNVSLDVIKIAFSELHSFGLINTDKGIFGTMTAGQGLELLRDRVSNVGLRFIEFIKTPD
jgi:hypothetical protein